jgi:branched-chain amino acid transport system permease protein
MLAQTIVTGLSIGSVYSLMAVGYSLIFSILSFSNFAHGAVIMLGGYIGFALASKLHLGFGLVVAGSVAGAGFISVINERVAYSALRRRKAPPLYLMISAMGCSMFLENTVYATIGSGFYAFPEFFSRQAVNVGGVSLSVLDACAFAVSAGAICALHLFITRTRMGIAIRAGVNDMTMCSLMGVDTDRLISVVFFIAGAFAGVAGVFLGVKYLVYPTMGWVTNKAYIAAVIGGLGSLPGAMVGGLILGVLETLVSTYLSSVMRDVFSFSMLIALLLCLPNGLMGTGAEEKI